MTIRTNTSEPQNLSLFHQGDRIAILAGAGISLDSPSRLLDGGSFMRGILKHARPPEVSEELAIGLLNRPKGLSRPGEFLRFEIIMKALSDSGLDPSLSVLDCLDNCDRPNDNHFVLAGLIHSGSVVMTTNFDRLIELAYDRLNPGDWPPLRIAIDDEDYPSELPDSSHPTLWKLHGSLSHNGRPSRESIRATVNGILSGDAQRPGLMFLREVLAKLDLLVIGYSGWDDLDIMPSLDTKSSQRLIWVEHDSSGNSPQIQTAEEKIEEFEQIWPRDVIGRERLWQPFDSEGTYLREPSKILLVRGHTRAILGSVATELGVALAYSPVPDPGLFDHESYFGQWKRNFAESRSIPYAFFLKLTDNIAFRSEVTEYRRQWRERLIFFRSEPEATQAERISFLLDQAGAMLHELSQQEIGAEEHQKVAEIENKLEEVTSDAEANVVPILVFLARFAYVRRDADRGEALFTKALDLAEKERNFPAQLMVVEGFLAAIQWATARGIRRTPRFPIVEDPRVSYEYLEYLRLRLGHQPTRWQEDVVAGTIAEVDDFEWQTLRLERILRHSVDVGDVVTEARASEKLGRIHLARAQVLGWDLPNNGWLRKKELENRTEREIAYHTVLALEELVRVEELGRIVDLMTILEEPAALAARIEHCKGRLGPRFNPELITKLRASIWRT